MSRAATATPAALEAWFVYVLRCGDGSLYTGIARDVRARLDQHRSGKGARYTRGRGPLVLIVKVRCRGKGEALRVELAVKALSRPEKEAMIARAGGLYGVVRKVRARTNGD